MNSKEVRGSQISYMYCARFPLLTVALDCARIALSLHCNFSTTYIFPDWFQIVSDCTACKCVVDHRLYCLETSCGDISNGRAFAMSVQVSSG